MANNHSLFFLNVSNLVKLKMEDDCERLYEYLEEKGHKLIVLLLDSNSSIQLI